MALARYNTVKESWPPAHLTLSLMFSSCKGRLPVIQCASAGAKLCKVISSVAPLPRMEREHEVSQLEGRLIRGKA